MKRNIIMAALLVCLTAMGVQAQKFGVVQTQDVLESMPGFTEMRTKLEAASKTYEDEFASLQSEMEKKYTEFQQMDANTPDAIKERRMQELQELDQKIGQFRNTAQQDIQRQQMALMQPLQEKIESAIKSVGQSGGYTFIFDSAMPYYTGTDVTDVTDQVKSLVK